jgi:hypothetical protein
VGVGIESGTLAPTPTGNEFAAQANSVAHKKQNKTVTVVSCRDDQHVHRCNLGELGGDESQRSHQRQSSTSVKVLPRRFAVRQFGINFGIRCSNLHVLFCPMNCSRRLGKSKILLWAILLCTHFATSPWNQLVLDSSFYFYFSITCIGKEKYYYICTLLLYIEKKGSFCFGFVWTLKVYTLFHGTLVNSSTLAKVGRHLFFTMGGW